MRVSRFFRNMNRGIVLLVVAALCLGGYVIYDNVAFKKEQPQIEQTLRGFIEKGAEMVLLPEGERTYKQVSKAAVEQKIKENNKIIDQYWTEADLEPWETSIATVKRDMETLIRAAVAPGSAENGLITKSEIKVFEIDHIKKTSPLTAEAEATFLTNCEFYGNAYFFNGSGANPLTWYSGEIVEDDLLRSYQNSSTTVTFELTKTGGGWKITGTGNSYTSASPLITVIE